MGIFLVYYIKSAVLLSVFYLLNRLLLEKETFHVLNRVLWIFIIPFSYVLALIDLRKYGAGSPVFGEDHLAGVIDPGLIQFDSPGTASGMATLLILLLILGSLALSITWVINLIRLKQGLSQTSVSYISLLDECKNIAGVKRKVNLYVLNRSVVPSSWMNNIIISESDIMENGREILLHELSHIRHGHSWDILIADILIIVQWFNPASWLLKRAIRQVHEYQADDEVIKSGINARQYQLLLIEKAVGKGLYSMANSFNHSKLKNRITMMLKKRSNKWAYAKCLYILPLALIAVSAFAVPEVSSRMDEISNLEFMNYFSKEPTKSFGNDTLNHDRPVFIVEGEEVMDIEQFGNNSIETVVVFKGEQAVERYGERGKNGVVEITLKENAQNVENPFTISARNPEEGNTTGTSDQKLNNVVIVRVAERPESYDTVEVRTGAVSFNDSSIRLRGTGSLTGNQNPLYIVDGKEVAEISSLSYSDIESVAVLKDQEAVSLYGEKGEAGVIIITLKKE